MLVRSAKGAMVSRLAHGGGTVVVFASQIAGFRRESASKEMTTPRAIAKQLHVGVNSVKTFSAIAKKKPELAEAVRQGKKTLNEARAEWRRRHPSTLRETPKDR